jgi:hypothetical protein
MARASRTSSRFGPESQHNSHFIAFGFSSLGVDKWGGLLADSITWASTLVAQMNLFDSFFTT